MVVGVRLRQYKGKAHRSGHRTGYSGNVLACPRSEEELEELLSRPFAADRAAALEWQGPLVLLGAGGKMGATLAMRARRAAPPGLRVVAVSRFTDARARDVLDAAGVETIAADLLAPGALEALPAAAEVVYLAARKFGTGADAASTWVTNAFLPGLVARRYADARIASFSTGNVYPLTAAPGPGPSEGVPPNPVGEYGQSALGRERIFEYFALTQGTPVALLRLNYAVELRYGVLADIVRRVAAGEPVDLRMGYVNVIWEGDAHSVCLRSLAHAAAPPFVLNLTGSECLSTRELAAAAGRLLGREPVFSGAEAPTALLSNAARCRVLFGEESIGVETLLAWTVEWQQAGRTTWGKPTHFQARDGRF
jgi:hypothetical protein